MHYKAGSTDTMVQQMHLQWSSPKLNKIQNITEIISHLINLAKGWKHNMPLHRAAKYLDLAVLIITSLVDILMASICGSAEINGKLPHLFIPNKTTTWLLSLQWKTFLWTELQPWFLHLQ